jgi:hypothetical protein
MGLQNKKRMGFWPLKMKDLSNGMNMMGIYFKNIDELLLNA